MPRNWIRLRQVEGTASRQAHVRLPEGTFEREISKEGFFGPSAQFHHKHKPTDWVAFEGPIRPRAFDMNKLAKIFGATALAPHDPGRQFSDLAYAPPMRPHIVDDEGHAHLPFVYPLRLVDRLEHRFAEDRSTRVQLQWFSGGTLVTTDESHGPWLILGATSAM